MERIEVFVAKKEGVQLPCYATKASSGVDLCAFIEEPLTLKPLERFIAADGHLYRHP